TSMLKYYGGTIFIRNVRDPIFKVQRADRNRNLNVNGYPIKVQSNLEGTAGIIIMGNEPDFGHERKNLNNFQSQLLEIKSNRVFPLEVSQQELNVVHFLGTWCGPCKKDLPLLHALRDQYPNVPFTGIACENNIDLDQLQELAKNYDLNWRFLVDQNVLADHHNLANQLGIHFFPTYLVVNQDGKVVFRDSDVEKLNAFLKDHN
ncbi:MAG: TlpA family protein disulfide reductase, partial [Saprospiraceae bacterium]|nr:TlpA family protein disulfide reductase [Saprospiraceae bacterium]